MVALIIIGIIALIIFLIMRISIGADIGYVDNEFRLAAKICGLSLQLLPAKEKDESEPKKEKKPKKQKKPKKEKKKKEEDPDKPKKKFELNFTFDEIMAVVKKVFEGLGKFRKMSIDRFMLHFTAAGDDPYKTAVTFGYLNAALSFLAPVCERRFNCKDSDVWTDIDFTIYEQKIDFGLAFSIRIGQIFSVINTIIFGVLGIFIKNRIRLLVEKIKNKLSGKKTEALPEPEDENITALETENIKLNIKPDERTEIENGKE